MYVEAYETSSKRSIFCNNAFVSNVYHRSLRVDRVILSLTRVGRNYYIFIVLYKHLKSSIYNNYIICYSSALKEAALRDHDPQSFTSLKSF